MHYRLWFRRGAFCFGVLGSGFAGRQFMTLSRGPSPSVLCPSVALCGIINHFLGRSNPQTSPIFCWVFCFGVHGTWKGDRFDHCVSNHDVWCCCAATNRNSFVFGSSGPVFFVGFFVLAVRRKVETSGMDKTVSQTLCGVVCAVSRHQRFSSAARRNAARIFC